MSNPDIKNSGTVAADREVSSSGSEKNYLIVTRAIEAGVTSCETCESVVPYAADNCPVCHTKVHPRHDSGLMMAWMWILTSAIFYIPAMYFPVSVVEYLGNSEATTLIQTVIHFWHGGSIPVALVIFIASVFIPAFKIIAVVYILIKISMHKQNIQQSKQITKLYHFVEFIGRWSMIDVFVVALLVSLVNFGGLATIVPDLGIFCFTMVVLTSMFAANSIDIRILWDKTKAYEAMQTENPDNDSIIIKEDAGQTLSVASGNAGAGN